jgi:hypothetical protein
MENQSRNNSVSSCGNFLVDKFRGRWQKNSITLSKLKSGEKSITVIRAVAIKQPK